MDDRSDLSSDLRDRLDERRSGTNTNGTLVLSDPEGYVGDEITLMGRNVPADEQYELVWHTTDGKWGVMEANRIVGPQYQRRTVSIATVRSDEDGRFDETWTIPEDFGGSHRIVVRDDSGETIARAEFEVTPWFELDRTEAPMGGSFVLRGYGIGPSVEANNFQVAWDNRFVGFMTGVMNRGTATARIRAVGPPGEHVIQVWRNYRGVPFVANNTQSPLGTVGGERQNAWKVGVTPPENEPPTAWVDELLEEEPFEVHYPDLDEDTAAELSISPQCGQAGTHAIITGRNFPADAEVDLHWYQHVGEGIRGFEVTPTV